MNYLLIKHLHQSAVLLSALGFAARWLASLAGAPWVQSRWAQTLPHAIDTVLLASALTLAGLLRLNPVHAPWLMAKILGLLVYIALGMVALRPRFSRVTRAAAGAAALLVLGWMVSVAVGKSPLGFFAPLA